jgi:cellulose synthase (UDP-forming)
MIELIPTSTAELWHFAPCALVAVFYLAIAPALPRQRTWARALVVMVALALAVRYLAWRWLESMPAGDRMTPEGLWSLGIYLVELLAFLNYSVLLLTLCRWTSRSGEADRYEAALRKLPVDRLPSVDVFIPTYNEGPDVLKRTIVAALGIDYPKFEVWVLDDGGRDWLAEFCAESGVHYLRRPDGRHAKAGNLNHALSVTTGELFAIFDADFAPSRNFLYRTVGFFADPRIGILQTPQHFFNPDPIQLNLGLARVVPDEQRLFFDVIAPSRDAWDCAFCCGSCSLQRRAAIEAVGGVPTESITEDILSTLVLLRKGYVTRYLDERLSMGLAAESLEGYFTQRTRWCRGAIQTLFLKSGPLGPGLFPLQRLFFLPLDWLIQYPIRLVAMAVPIVYLWTGVGPFVITSTDELIAYQLPAYVALASTLRFFAPDRYIPVLSTAVSLFTSLRIAPTVLSSLVKPFGAPFRVTPKGSNNAASGGDWSAWIVVTLLAALTLGGLISNRVSSGPVWGSNAARVAAEIYALFNLAVLGLAAAMALELPRPRRGERFPIQQPGSYCVGGFASPCVVLDISESGALVGGVNPLATGAWLELDIRGIGVLRTRVVRRIEENIAVEFTSIAEHQRLRIIDFIYSSGLSNGVDRLRITGVLLSLFSFLLAVPSRANRSIPLKHPAGGRTPGRKGQGMSSLGIIRLGTAVRDEPESSRTDPRAISSRMVNAFDYGVSPSPKGFDSRHDPSSQGGGRLGSGGQLACNTHRRGLVRGNGD